MMDTKTYDELMRPMTEADLDMKYEESVPNLQHRKLVNNRVEELKQRYMELSDEEKKRFIYGIGY